MTAVLMVVTGNRFPVGEPEPALRTLQRLNSGFLVHADHDGVLRRVQIEADDVRRFRDELRVCTDAMTTPALKRDAAPPEHPPYLVVRHIAQSAGKQRAVPAGIPLGRRLIELVQDSFFSRFVIGSRLAGTRRISQCIGPASPETLLPFGDR